MSDSVIRTVPVKLDVGVYAPALRETARRFNAAATWIADVCWHAGITNTNTAHHRVYGETRERFGLGAQLAVCARAKAMEALKAERKKGGDTCPAWRADAAVRYDARTYRLLPLDGVSLNTVQGRVTVRMRPGQRQRDLLLEEGWRIGGADLVQRTGVWYLHLTQHKPAPELDEPTGGYLGIDVGIAQIATDSDGDAYDGAHVKAVRERRFTHRQRLQKRNTRRSRARLRALTKKEHRFQKDVNHVISKALVAKAKDSCKALVLEDLTNINQRTAKTVRHEQRRERGSWAFDQLRFCIAYKAAQDGVRVILVDPRNTSRQCHECGYVDKRNRVDQSHFRCLSCGHTAHADHNAARNIASRALVNAPTVLPIPTGIHREHKPPALAVGPLTLYASARGKPSAIAGCPIDVVPALCPVTGGTH